LLLNCVFEYVIGDAGSFVSLFGTDFTDGTVRFFVVAVRNWAPNFSLHTILRRGGINFIVPRAISGDKKLKTQS